MIKLIQGAAFGAIGSAGISFLAHAADVGHALAVKSIPLGSFHLYWSWPVWGILSFLAAAILLMMD